MPSQHHQSSGSLGTRVPSTIVTLHDTCASVHFADVQSHAIDISTVNSETASTSVTSSDNSPAASLNISSSDWPTPQLSSPSDGDSSDGSQGLEDPEHGSGEVRSATFQDILFNALVDPPGCPKRRRFFPNTTFTEVINERIVSNELQRCLEFLDPAETNRLTRAICGTRSFKRIFALLALVEKLSDIGHFVEYNVADDCLPLSKIAPPGSNLFTLGFRASLDDSIKSIACLDRWAPATIRIFEEWQWTTLAPTFQRGEPKSINHMTLPDDVPLPFTADSQYDTGRNSIQSGHSTVFRIAIHPAHHGFLEFASSGNFAVKRLLSKNKAEFDQEVQMLMTFSGHTHQNLISLLATYEQYNEFYLIFPWATGDLQSFWRDIEPEPSTDRTTILWTIQECLGLARGLATVHRHRTTSLTRLSSAFDGHRPIPDRVADTQVWPLFGVHGDIKPQNILLFKDSSSNTHRGTLKISDFGLAEFKSSNTKIYRPSGKIAVSACYRPPECELKDGRVGQSQDIWALGCLYLEMLAWLLGGWHLVQSFQQRRATSEAFSYYGNVADEAFFRIESVSKDGIATVMVKPAVTDFINHLRGLATGIKYLCLFLDIIETEMLIIKPTDQREKGRIGAAELVSKLNVVWQACESTKCVTNPVAQHKAKRSRNSEALEDASRKRG